MTTHGLQVGGRSQNLLVCENSVFRTIQNPTPSCCLVSRLSPSQGTHTLRASLLDTGLLNTDLSCFSLTRLKVVSCVISRSIQWAAPVTLASSLFARPSCPGPLPSAASCASARASEMHPHLPQIRLKSGLPCQAYPSCINTTHYLPASLLPPQCSVPILDLTRCSFQSTY